MRYYTREYGRPSRPQYGSCPSVRPSVCLSVCPKNKKAQKKQIGLNLNVPTARVTNFNSEGQNLVRGLGCAALGGPPSNYVGIGLT